MPFLVFLNTLPDRLVYKQAIKRSIPKGHVIQCALWVYLILQLCCRSARMGMSYGVPSGYTFMLYHEPDFFKIRFMFLHRKITGKPFKTESHTNHKESADKRNS